MRFTLLTILLMTSTVTFSSEINSIEKAWGYLTETGRSNQWVVIESKKNGRYVQCANMGDFLKCPFPVWNKAIPTVKNTAPKASRGTPFIEVAGSKMREYISTADVAVLKNAIRKQGLNPEDVYSQLVDERNHIVGTSYEVVVILEPSFSRFSQFVQYVLQAVWGGTPKDGYAIETNS